MSELLKGLKKGVVFYSIIAIIVGIVFMMYPQTTSQLICYVIAFIIIVSGIMDFVRYFSNDFHYAFRYDLLTGFLLCAIGLFMVIRSDIVIMMIPFVIGMFIVVEGFLNAVRSFHLRNWGFVNWRYDLLLSLLLMVFGLILLFDPFDAAMFSVIFIGVCFVYDGILNLLILYRTHQFVREINHRYE